VATVVPSHGRANPRGMREAAQSVDDDPTLPVSVMEVVPLSRRFALDICTWRYPAPYHCYDMTEADPEDLLQPELGFFAVVHNGALIGFVEFLDQAASCAGQRGCAAQDVNAVLNAHELVRH